MDDTHSLAVHGKGLDHAPQEHYEETQPLNMSDPLPAYCQSVALIGCRSERLTSD